MNVMSSQKRIVTDFAERMTQNPLNSGGRTPDAPAESCSPATYLREAPIGGCCYKKLLDLFWRIFNILRKKGRFYFKIVGTEHLFLFYIIIGKRPARHFARDELI
jgi:hypothetical protein